MEAALISRTQRLEQQLMDVEPRVSLTVLTRFFSLSLSLKSRNICLSVCRELDLPHCCGTGPSKTSTAQ